eukprot:353454-Chlamydomonas_euryale.AAC.5
MRTADGRRRAPRSAPSAQLATDSLTARSLRLTHVPLQSVGDRLAWLGGSRPPGSPGPHPSTTKSQSYR